MQGLVVNVSRLKLRKRLHLPFCEQQECFTEAAHTQQECFTEAALCLLPRDYRFLARVTETEKRQTASEV